MKFNVGDIVKCVSYNRCFHEEDIVIIIGICEDDEYYKTKVLETTYNSECKVAERGWTIEFDDEICWELYE